MTDGARFGAVEYSHALAAMAEVGSEAGEGANVDSPAVTSGVELRPKRRKTMLPPRRDCRMASLLTGDDLFAKYE